ncbi:MAG: CARDB domain-containing protein, partial [Ferruginibacter sp.]
NNTGRWLFSSQVPALSGYQWYRNSVLIPGATNASYYASLAGGYTVKFENYCGSGPVSNTISFAANSIPQTINFPVIPNKTYGDAPFVPNATATSGLPVSLTILSGPATINAQTNLLTITGTGLVTVLANQIGDNVYDTAVPVSRSFTVNKATQTITFPAIPDQDFSNLTVTLTASSTSALPTSYSIVSGPATVSGNLLTLTGLGTVTVRAFQNGDTNYLPATAVDRSFCTRVADLNTISGYTNLCPGTATYTINNIPGATYFWRIAGGSTLASTTNSANVTWTTPGTYSLLVSASGSCGAASANDTLVVTVINSIQPDSVQSMLPPNGAINQQLPLTLSWVPAHPNNFYTFDLYLWRADLAQPGTPYAANLTTVNYTLPVNSGLSTNQPYKWMVVSHNGSCTQINTGPIQQFTLIPLPDLVVQNVQAPTTAFSGQTITINWTVSNPGPGNTTTNQSWTDGVFLTFDTIPNFSIPPQTDPAAWGQLDYPSRPLLIGTRPNVSALNSGQQYSNSINFTLPVSYSLPLYAYVITNYPSNSNALQQITRANDTARAPQAIAVTLSPTPDLRVDTVFAPGTTFSGSTISVTYKVKNYGVVTPAGSAWTDKVYVSQSPIFNINTAIPVKLPKPNGTYYANASDATVSNDSQLQADSVYTRSLLVVVPNYIFGTWFIYVAANATNTLYEGALNNNNLNRSQAQVFLTPTPHLTVSSLTVPVTTASITQQIGANWNISNTGFTDNIEKNKGHYFVLNGVCTLTNPPIPGIAIRDSVDFGSSYWVDRVYLSTDPTSLDTANAILVNETSQGLFNSGLNVPDTLIPYPCQPSGTNSAQFNVNTFNVIKPGSNHPKAANFTIPSNIPAGNYYVYVLTNASRSVFEYPGTPETRRSVLPITIQRPDAIVSAVTVPANAVGGQTITINYSILNNGPGAVFNHVRRDKIYVSVSPVFNGSAQLIDSLTYTEGLPVGTAVLHTLNYTFPASTSGTRYFYVHTNFDSAFRETNSNNNISAAATTIVTSAAPSDLVVSNIQLADTVFAVFPANIKYTITNNGTGTTSGTWKDSIFISCSPTFNPATSYYIAKRSHSEILTTGNSYTDSFSVNMDFAFNINNCFPKINMNTAYFFIKTNADNAVYEGSNGNNNVTGSGSRVLINPSVDHMVTAVTGPDTAIVARSYPINWTVKNIGYNPGLSYYTGWYDAIYFSPDSIFNNNAVIATGYFESTPLNTNQVYSDTRNAIPPNIPTGEYYVFANTNYYPPYGIAHETVVNNNTNLIRNGAGAAKKIHVIQPLLPDLTDSIITAAALVAVGQPLTLVHRTTNNGTGVTFPANWSDDLWLSPDFIPGNNGFDIPLSGKNHVGALQHGESYTDTVTVTIPMNVAPGNYILISRVNATGNLFESNNNNNLAFKYITIYNPAPSDLIVENVMKPDTVLLGYTFDTAKWVIKNISANAATGVSSDGIYLSANSILDSTAVLLGIKNKTINMAPLSMDTISMAPLVLNVTEGNYNVIVKTDLLNNIVESNKNNNTGIAVSQLYVKVNELPLNVPTPNTLHTVNRFYKLIVPDSLSGATILVTLKSGDSLTMNNQMFIGNGYVPSAAHFDYTYSIPNYGNQEIVMTSAIAGVHYITIRCVSSNPVLQNITLKAVKLPFAILNVHTNSGGNSGNVTIKISGSLFVNNMSARLAKPGTTIHASAVYFTNSTTVYATFNLQGKPLGIYDVTLTKPDSATATLANGFSVVLPNNGGIITGGGVNTGPGNGNAPGCAPGAASGLNSQLVTEIVAPDRVLIGWSFVIQINYNNPTNVDIPAQARALYSDHDVLMSLTPAGVANGTTSLYLELTEQDGPPGIIRAGGSGSILIYSKMHVSLPRGTVVLFNLK